MELREGQELPQGNTGDSCAPVPTDCVSVQQFGGRVDVLSCRENGSRPECWCRACLLLALRLERTHPLREPSSGVTCCVCGLPIAGGKMYGMGDGTMRDGGRFGCPECYWRSKAESYLGALLNVKTISLDGK